MNGTRTTVRLLRAVSVGALLVAAVAVGDGGNHQPPKPPGPPPPPWNGPGDVLPGPGGGPSGPSQPKTPGGGASGPSTPGAPAPGPGGGPTQPGGNPATALTAEGIDLSRWELWWRFNRDEFLVLKDAIRAMPPESGSDDGFFLGHGADRQITRSPQLTGEELAERVAPALVAVLRDDGQQQAHSSCLLALAKLGALPAAEVDARSLIQEFLDSSNQKLSEVAVLALGVLGEPSALPTLVALVSDSAAGARLVGRTRVPVRTRAFAAYGMGVLASECANPDVRRFAAHRLAHELASDDTATKDLGVACVNALALIELPGAPEHLEAEGPAPPASASGEAMLRFLIERLEDGKTEKLVRAHLPRAIVTIAMHGGGEAREAMRIEAADALVGALDNGRTPREVVDGCVMALGRLGFASETVLDRKIALALERVVKGSDTTARNLALIALGRISGRPGPDGSLGQLGRVTKLLMRSLAQGTSRTRPWAALALGVQGYELLALNLDPSTDATAALRTAFAECGSPEEIGAYALALGLRRDIESSATMMTRIFRFSDDDARGAIAIAIALTGDQTGVEFFRQLLPEAAWRPDFLRPLVEALALLGDKGLVPLLVERIAREDSSARKTVDVWALMHVGDARAIDTILAMLADESVTDFTRSVAAMAAGFIAERHRKPWNSSLAIGVNYLATPETLYVPAGDGVLNKR